MKTLLYILFFTLINTALFAQLPNIEVVTVKGKNVISWMNTYANLQGITVQRCADSTGKYTSIGTINKPKKGGGAYSDDAPLKGKNYYQLIITFNPEVEWYSKRKGIFLDSTMLAKSMSLDANTANNAAKDKALQDNPTLAYEEVKPAFTFTPSNHVFTNTYTGHINIVLENALSKKYSLIFYGNDHKEILHIDRISYDNVVLDKHNFNGKGTFSFSLLEGGVEVEKGFVNVL